MFAIILNVFLSFAFTGNADDVHTPPVFTPTDNVVVVDLTM